VKLEYLPKGSPECPLIRLYDFDQLQAKRLSKLVKSLAAGDRENVALHNEAWVESVGECCLRLQSGKRNQRIRTTPSGTFECVLSAEGWKDIEGLLEPFRESKTSGFRWLTRQGKIALLISPSGQW